MANQRRATTGANLGAEIDAALDPNGLAIRLFGRFSVETHARAVEGLDAAKVQELLAYLLVHGGRPHARTVLASVLWAECPQGQAQKYLRQSLWQLQSALTRTGDLETNSILSIEPDWIGISPDATIYLDVAVLERTVRAVHGKPGEALLAPDVALLREAARVYRGDLLEGWHQDWCLLARERLQTMYLGVLNKLMASAEAHDDFESGLLYGYAVLRHDRAHERTHRRLMRLQYLAGDRTAALRQYHKCVDALHEELAVKPSRHTVLLYEQIKNDDLGNVDASDATNAGLARELLSRLRVVRAGLVEFERQLLSGLDG